MKKITLVAVAAIGMTLFASCKKDHTCTCKATFNGATSEVSQTMPKTSKSEAKKACDGLKATSALAGTGATVECSLK